MEGVEKIHYGCGLPWDEHVWAWDEETKDSKRFCPDDSDYWAAKGKRDPLKERPSGHGEPDTEDLRWEDG